MERSILITEGFTGQQTEDTLRTVVGAKMGPRPVCGPLRPLCARPSPPGLGSARGPVSVPFLRCTRSWSRRGGGAGADPPRSPRGSLSLPSDLVQGACPEQPVGPGWGDMKGPPCPLPDPVSSSKGQRRTVVNPARAGGPGTCSPAANPPPHLQTQTNFPGLHRGQHRAWHWEYRRGQDTAFLPLLGVCPCVCWGRHTGVADRHRKRHPDGLRSHGGLPGEGSACTETRFSQRSHISGRGHSPEGR